MIPKFCLLVGFYRDRVAERERELISCLERNVANDLFEAVHVVIEEKRPRLPQFSRELLMQTANWQADGLSSPTVTFTSTSRWHSLLTWTSRAGSSASRDGTCRQTGVLGCLIIRSAKMFGSSKRLSVRSIATSAWGRRGVTAASRGKLGKQGSSSPIRAVQSRRTIFT
jgi:hypothetical protein